MKSILLVDDDCYFRGLLAELLSKEYKVYEAYGVNDALVVLNENSVDMICSDYNMTDGTGLDLFRNTRSNYSKIPFVIMSAVDNDRISESSAKYGFTFIEKTDYDFLNIIKSQINNTKLEN